MALRRARPIAGELQPAALRSLDALRLATILSLGEEVGHVYR